jgi:hypothetical protein
MTRTIQMKTKKISKRSMKEMSRTKSRVNLQLVLGIDRLFWLEQGFLDSARIGYRRR